MKVLILDSDSTFTTQLEYFLKKSLSFDCCSCHSIAEFRQVSKKFKPDVYLIDVILANGQIFSILDELDPSRSIIITNYVTDRLSSTVSSLGFYSILVKPINFEVLRGMLEALKLKIKSPASPLVTRLISTFPQVFKLFNGVIDANAIQEGVEIIGKHLNANIVVAPFDEVQGLSYPLFAFYLTERLELQIQKFPSSWIESVKSGEVVVIFKDPRIQELFGKEINRVLIAPISNEVLGNWGYFLTFDGRKTPYSSEVVTFIHSCVVVVGLALVRLNLGLTLKSVLEDAITRVKVT